MVTAIRTSCVAIAVAVTTVGAVFGSLYWVAGRQFEAQQRRP
jgi:hypothetical protein